MKRFVSWAEMLFLLPLALVASAVRVEAQSPSRETAPPELVRTITSLDSALFDSYNRCDLERFATFWTDDVEFYHDQGGMSVGARAITDGVRRNICGKVRRERDSSLCWLLDAERHGDPVAPPEPIGEIASVVVVAPGE